MISLFSGEYNDLSERIAFFNKTSVMPLSPAPGATCRLFEGATYPFSRWDALSCLSSRQNVNRQFIDCIYRSFHAGPTEKPPAPLEQGRGARARPGF